MRDQGRHYKPTGQPLEDGRNLYHLYARLEPWEIGLLKLISRGRGESYAQTAGRLLSQVLSEVLITPDSPEQTQALAEEVGRSVKPVKPSKGRPAND